jgi:drug/metabolite transporter (DMT)-like permease
MKEWAIRGVCFCLFVISNAAMATLFAQALRKTDSVTATTVNTSIGFLASGLLGWLLGENMTASWFLGALLVFIGLFLLQRPPVDQKLKPA